MTKKDSLYTAHNQIAGVSSELCVRINALLQTKGLEEVRFSVAYARWDGIALISAALEEFLTGGGRFKAVYGAGNGVTSADALYYGILLDKRFPGRTFVGIIEDKYANSIFHPKFYEFRYADHIVTLVGSANLTGGGLARNGELVVECSIPLDDPLVPQFAQFWKHAKGNAQKVTAPLIAKLAQSQGAGKERSDEVGGAKAGKPFLKIKSKAATRPIFAKILDSAQLTYEKKSEILALMTDATARPKHLYLQIFEKETGGSKGHSGCAVQIPVAVLGSYFGIKSGDGRELLFNFANEQIKTHVIHNSNHTHQIRLSPIFSVHRPAIIHFERIDADQYRARFVPQKSYAKILLSKCPHQRRKGARRWGIFV